MSIAALVLFNQKNIPKGCLGSIAPRNRLKKIAVPMELETYGMRKQCAAVSTQQGSMRLPPHRKWSLPLMVWKMPAIQG